VDVVEELSRAAPGMAVSTGAPDLAFYGRDLWPRHLIEIQAGRYPVPRPRAVVWPTSAAELAGVIALARAEGYKVVPFGAGSGVCGAVLPDDRTIVADVKRMADFRVERGPRVVAGAGALGITLEDELGRRGYTMGHFPSSIICSTVGGWLAARSAGQCSGRYGKIEDMVVAAECVLGTGEIVKLERRRSQPSLLPLVIGSEGTLGVITRAEIRLHAAPALRAFSAFSFPDLASGCDALRELFQSGLRPAVTRLYDPLDSLLLGRGSVRETETPRPKARFGRVRDELLGALTRTVLSAPYAVHRAVKALESTLASRCTLILVFEGDAESVADGSARAAALARGRGADALGEGPARAWFEHRYSVSYRQSPVFRAGAFNDTFEVAAPWSKVPDVYARVRRALGEHAVVLAHLSHAYPDGCSIYFTFVGTAHGGRSAEQVYDAAWRAALDAALAAGATLSHHHGIGRSKAPYLGAELGFGRELVRRVMRTCDPDGILNPGALLGRDQDLVPRPGPSEPALGIDTVSELATFEHRTTLGAAERTLADHGLSLGLDAAADFELPLGLWLARGFPWTSDPLSDPVRQILAGFSARLASGERLVVHPAPRRATGPDLSALFVGAAELVGRAERLTVSVRRRGLRDAGVQDFEGESDPPMSDVEQVLWARIARSAVG
jgi:alkyldihydroxyacetonephosphate synthase